MANHTEDKKSFKRRKIYVDRDVQTALLRQLAFSWLGVLGVLASVLLAMESYKAGFTLGVSGCLIALWKHNAALLIALAVLAPIVAYDMVRLSHRFAGPMISFRRALKRLGQGENVEPIYFRENDYWKDMAVNFNLMLDRVEGAETVSSEDDEKPVLVAN